MRARREAMGLSTRALAHALDINPKKLMEMEAGSRPIPDGLADDLRHMYGDWVAAVEANVDNAIGIAEELAASRGAEPARMDFYVYGSKDEFEAAGGRAKYGTGWAGHTQYVATTALLVEAEGIAVAIRRFTDDPAEPSNLHEPRAEDR